MGGDDVLSDAGIIIASLRTSSLIEISVFNSN